ncbi:MAG: serine--tRNA ligase [Pseudomonadota bacterium]
MLDIQLLRNHPEDTQRALAKKKFDLNIDEFQTLDSARRDAETQVQQLQAQRNKVSKEVGQLIKQGVPVDEAKQQVQKTLEDVDTQLEALTQAARVTDKALDDFLAVIPNVPADEVPEGNDEADNLEVLTWGEPKSFDAPVKDHVDLGEQSNALDFNTAAKITGSRFVVMRGGLAKMNRALIQFMLDQHTQVNGYEEVYVPYIVNKDSLFGTGQLPKFEDDSFKLENTEYYLIPTAEVPVTNLLRDVIVEQSGSTDFGDMPLKFVAHTPCFRSEAGSYGRDTRGMIRQHQFEKVELVQFVYPEQGEAALEELTQHAEGILQQLELPYRKVLLCGGDLGFSSRKTYDLEVWLPSQNTYREISSCSYFDNYQARRLSAKYRSADAKKPQLLHTLNGSGLAVGRCLLAIMENYQQADGSIRIPDALQPYMNQQTAIMLDS